MFKRKAPVAIGLGLVAAFAAGIALLQPQPRDADLLSPAHRTIRERYERLGHALPPETIRTTLLSRAETEGFVRVELPTLARVHLLRLTCTDAWKVDADLADHFNAYLT
ncbi:MAG: hypothetical protein HYY16_13745, partial [Planctomycetes bacterium]|nr:hypothetical protein [Planctomycetota bacterium]